MNWNQKFLSSLKWSVGARGISQAISWISTIYVIRHLAPSDYGVVAIAMVVIDLSVIAAEFGLTPALIQKERVNQQFIQVAYGFTLVSGLLIAVLCILAAPFLAQWFDNLILTEVIRVFSLQFVIVSVGAVYYALLQREMRFKEISGIQLVSNISGGISSLLLAYNGFGVWTLVIAPLTTLAIENAGYIFVTKHKIYPRWSNAILAPEIKFGSDILFQKLISKLNGQIDTIFIGKILDVALLGGYSTAKHLVSIPVSKIMPILNSLMFPMFSRIQDQPQLARDAYLNILDALTFILILLLWGLAATVDIAIPLILGEQWTSIESIVMIISIFSPFTVIYYTATSLFYSSGRSRTALWITAMNFVFVVTSIVLASDKGIVWIALGINTAYTFTSLISVINLKKIIGLELYSVLRILILNISCGLIMFFTIRLISNYAGNISVSYLLCIEALSGVFVFFITRELVVPGSLMRIKQIIGS